VTQLQSGLGGAVTVATRLRGILNGLRMPAGAGGGGAGAGGGGARAGAGGRGPGLSGVMGEAYSTMWTTRMLATPFIGPLQQAAEMQSEMIGIRATVGNSGTPDAMNDMRKVIEQAAAPTMFSITEVAKMAKIIASSNSFSAQQVSSLIPVYAQFADVQKLMKGTSLEESTMLGVRMAHQAGHFDPEGLAKYLDLLTKASLVVPGTLSEVGNALKYSQAFAKTTLGVDDNQMVMTALLNRMGLSGSRGGTNLIDAMIRTVPGIFGSGLLKGKSAEALKAMGFTDAQGHSTIFSDGKFDTIKWMNQLSKYTTDTLAKAGGDPRKEAIAR
jgi:TP901 family phage tail tape measure protein